MTRKIAELDAAALYMAENDIELSSRSIRRE